mgnify:FL=1
MSPPPVRTNLDERMSILRGMMDRFFQMVHEGYTTTYRETDREVAFQDSMELRNDAAAQAEHLAQELLLVLSLNQPLLSDLRIVAASLRSLDVLERLARHARDIANARRGWAERAKEGATFPHGINEGLDKMHQEVLELLMLARACFVEQESVPVERILELHSSVDLVFAETLEALLEESKSKVAGREGRLLLVTIARRLERSAYNLMRLFDLWNHAQTNQWIRFESMAHEN